jgi:hypothetical protein
MDKRDRIDLLVEAQDKLSQAISLIEEGLRGTSHARHADAYIIGHLRSWIDAYGYDMGIQQYIDRLDNEDEEEDDEDED